MVTKSFHRLKIHEIYSALNHLKDSGWHSEVVYTPKEVWKGKEISFPIMAYTSPKSGSALWIISGIHGEEPAGPCAIAENIDTIRELGQEIPVVLLPLCNPHGYFKEFRYPRQKEWVRDGENKSVGDCEFYLPGKKNPSVPRASIPACPESAALSAKVLGLAKQYPPIVSVDLHEDDLLSSGYIYCSGTAPELAKSTAQYVVSILKKNGVFTIKSGETRFGESIDNGIVFNSKDGSVDELLSSKKIIVNNRVVPGPSSKVSIVVETPAKSLPLAKRIRAHSAVIRSLKRISELAGL